MNYPIQKGNSQIKNMIDCPINIGLFECDALHYSLHPTMKLVTSLDDNHAESWGGNNLLFKDFYIISDLMADGVIGLG